MFSIEMLNKKKCLMIFNPVLCIIEYSMFTCSSFYIVEIKINYVLKMRSYCEIFLSLLYYNPEITHCVSIIYIDDYNTVL
jgi:hypothetical protein